MFHGFLYDERLRRAGAIADANENLANPVDGLLLGDHVSNRLRQLESKHHGQQQRHCAAEMQNATPAELRNHPRCKEATECGAQRKAAEHQVDDGGAALVRTEFAHERHRIGHRRAQTHARDKAQGGQLRQIRRVARTKTRQTEQQHRAGQYKASPPTVRYRA